VILKDQPEALFAPHGGKGILDPTPKRGITDLAHEIVYPGHVHRRQMSRPPRDGRWRAQTGKGKQEPVVLRSIFLCL
jgi:hypothetical protein